MQRGDRIRQLILHIIESAHSPLETPEVVARVQEQTSTTRTIVFKRLTDLRGDGLIRGKHTGSGKGVWIWWPAEGFQQEETSPSHDDKIVDTIQHILDSATAPLETKEVEERVLDAIPTSTRALVFKRLTNLRGDQAIKGKHVGSGKGVWIWWRNNALPA